MSAVTVGVSLKMYFGHERARVWFDEVAARVRDHAAVRSGAVELFVTPTYMCPRSIQAMPPNIFISVASSDCAVYARIRSASSSL